MYLSIKNEKHQGIARSCYLLLNGKKVAEARNAGNGSKTVVTWTDRDAEDAVRAHAHRCSIIILEGNSHRIAEGLGPNWAGDYVDALADARGSSFADRELVEPNTSPIFQGVLGLSL